MAKSLSFHTLNFAALLFWELGWLVKGKRQDLRELNLKCGAANIDFLLIS
jgi:hypothetical protein